MPKVDRLPKFRNTSAHGSLPRNSRVGKASFGGGNESDDERKADVMSRGSTSVLPESSKSAISSSTSSLLTIKASNPIRFDDNHKANALPFASADASSMGGNKNAPSHAPATNTLSRGQRKRQAKKNQYLRQEELIRNSLKLKHDNDQKKRIDGFDALRHALMATTTATATTTSYPSGDASDRGTNERLTEKNHKESFPTNESKKKLLQREAAQMSLVLQHPSYQQDPFDAIRQHLTITMAKGAARRKTEEKIHQKEIRRNLEEKQKKKKEHPRKKRNKNKHKVRATRSKTR